MNTKVAQNAVRAVAVLAVASGFSSLRHAATAQVAATPVTLSA